MACGGLPRKREDAGQHRICSRTSTAVPARTPSVITIRLILWIRMEWISGKLIVMVLLSGLKKVMNTDFILLTVKGKEVHRT